MVRSFLRKEQDPNFSVVKDPVRRGTPMQWRIVQGREVYSLVYDDEIAAVICVAYCNEVPVAFEDLENVNLLTNPTIAIPYTVWSLKHGFGRSIIFETIKTIKEASPEITRVVTLSPKTEMAYRFHIGNGAVQISSNAESDNYEYK